MHHMSNVIVWDIETVPDLKGFAAANGHIGKADDEVRAELGDKFPKHIYHSIICILNGRVPLHLIDRHINTLKWLQDRALQRRARPTDFGGEGKVGAFPALGGE